MTTFQVYPSLDIYPTFEEVVKQGTAALDLYLGRIGIAAHPQISVSVRSLDGDIPQPISLSDPLKWSNKSYALFSIEGVEGGSDAYYLPMDAATRDYWIDDLFSSPRYQKREALIRTCLSMDHYWVFRCGE